MNRPIRVIRAAALGCIAAVLVGTGCAVTPARPKVDNPREVWEDRIQAMRAIDEWEVRGRLAVKTSKRGESVNLYWRRQQENHNINLYGPMGAGRVVLTQDDRGATLHDRKGETYEDDSAEDLLYRAVGWRVPFDSLQHWVLGVAAPDSQYEMKLDGWGRLAALTQNGWTIQFLEYDRVDGRDLPRKLVMNALPGTEHIVGDKEGENETIQVKALIKRWEWP